MLKKATGKIKEITQQLRYNNINNWKGRNADRKKKKMISNGKLISLLKISFHAIRFGIVTNVIDLQISNKSKQETHITTNKLAIIIK